MRPDGNNAPCHVVAHQTESRYSGIVLHYPTQCALCILGHRVGFVKYDDLVGRTGIFFAVGRHCLCTRGLSSKIFNFVAYNGYASFVRSVELENTTTKVVWPRINELGISAWRLTHSQKVVLLELEWSMSCQCPAGHKRAYEEATRK